MPTEANSKDDKQKPIKASRETGLSRAESNGDASDASAVPASLDDGPSPVLSDSAQRMIGVQLRKLYRDTVEEPVPKEFLRLLDELERQERGT